MPTPLKTYSDPNHAVVIADVVVVCKRPHGAVPPPWTLSLLLRNVATQTTLMDLTFDSVAERDAYYVGLVAAMG